MKKQIRVVAAAIIENGRVLVAQRPYSTTPYKSLKWEFPGGKIEPGEFPEQAIIREIREELDCDIVVDAIAGEIEHEYPDFILKMTLFNCHLIADSQPKALEHVALRWLNPSDLPHLDWAPADARSYPLILPFLLQS